MLVSNFLCKSFKYEQLNISTGCLLIQTHMTYCMFGKRVLSNIFQSSTTGLQQGVYGFGLGQVRLGQVTVQPDYSTELMPVSRNCGSQFLLCGRVQNQFHIQPRGRRTRPARKIWRKNSLQCGAGQRRATATTSIGCCSGGVAAFVGNTRSMTMPVNETK